MIIIFAALTFLHSLFVSRDVVNILEYILQVAISQARQAELRAEITKSNPCTVV